MTTLTSAPPRVGDLSVTRLNVMRAGYLFMGLGLVLVKWPLLPSASTRPVYEGVTLSMLAAMSVLALLGLRRPVAMLPVLVFESAWKLVWISLVALPKVFMDDLDTASTEILVNCSLVVVVLAVVPWRYVWQRYVRAPGDRWR